jgi:hypothetical protein
MFLDSFPNNGCQRECRGERGVSEEAIRLVDGFPRTTGLD